MKSSSLDAKTKLAHSAFKQSRSFWHNGNSILFHGPEDNILKHYFEHCLQFSGSGECLLQVQGHIGREHNKRTSANVPRVRTALQRDCARRFLRRAKLCLERNGGHSEHVLGAPRQSTSGPWICSQRKYNWTGFHLVPDSQLCHQYNRKDASFKFVWLFWDTRYLPTIAGLS